MSIVAAFDKTLFYNEASKYCVLRLKTADLMIPEDARTSFPFGGHLIRFTAQRRAISTWKRIHWLKTLFYC